MEKIFLAVGMLLELTLQMQKVAVIIEQARNEDRDISDEEMASVKSELAVSKSRLAKAIEDY